MKPIVESAFRNPTTYCGSALAGGGLVGIGWGLIDAGVRAMNHISNGSQIPVEQVLFGDPSPASRTGVGLGVMVIGAVLWNNGTRLPHSAENSGKHSNQ